MRTEDGQRFIEKSDRKQGYERLFDYVPAISPYQGQGHR